MNADAQLSEDDQQIPLAAFSEFWYCPRSFIYRYLQYLPLEEENFYILDGRKSHAKQDRQNFGFDRDGKKEFYRLLLSAPGFPIYGYADRVQVHNDKIVIVEIKRGKTRDNDQHHWQVRLMMLIAGMKWPEKGIEGFIYYDQSKRKIKVELLPEHEREIRRIIQLISMARQDYRIDLFKMVSDARCTGCMFQTICGEG